MGHDGSPRPPWEIVETFPTSSRELLEHWRDLVERSSAVEASPDASVRARVGLVLALYWAVQEGLEVGWLDNRQRREQLLAEAEEVAERSGDADLIAIAGLGRLYGLWGPDQIPERTVVLQRLEHVADAVRDPEIRLRIREWRVLGHFDSGDLAGARTEVDLFARQAADPDLRGFRRREELWRANLAMLEGRIDEAVKMNTDAISSTSDTAGSPFSFQNVAITVAIERYLRMGLGDVIESVRSIRASSPRVRANWDTGLAFCLAEAGHLEAAAELFDVLAEDDFDSVPRDLNWLVTIDLLGLVAVRLDDTGRSRTILEMLAGFAHLDATHGSGYASYGPVGRTCGLLAATTGESTRAAAHFAAVLESREPGPWTSLCRLDRSRLLAHCDQAHCDGVGARPHSAELRTAEGELRSMGMLAWAEEARSARAAVVSVAASEPSLVVDGEQVSFHGPLGSAEVSGVGAMILVRLLRAPGRTFAAAELEGTGRWDAAAPIQDHDSTVESTLDETARRQYSERLRVLEEVGGVMTPDQAEEQAFLRRALAGSRHRVAGSAELERSRVRVTKAIRRCITEVGNQSPRLGEHLAESVSTGRSCAYTPADGLGWDVVDVG